MKTIMKKTILIETLKEMHVNNTNACKSKYKKINELLKKAQFNKADKEREGYTLLWDKTNKMEDFFKKNNINFWTNYNSQTIENPNIY